MSSIKTLIALLLVVSGFLALKYLVQPKWAEVQALDAKIDQVQQALDETKRVIKIYDDLVSRYEAISPEEKERITEFLPAKPGVPDLLIDADIMTRLAGLREPQIEFQESAGGIAGASGNIDSVGLTVQAQGSYASLNQILGLLEKNLRLIDVTTITFSADREDKYNFKIQAKTYYQKKSIF